MLTVCTYYTWIQAITFKFCLNIQDFCHKCSLNLLMFNALDDCLLKFYFEGHGPANTYLGVGVLRSDVGVLRSDVGVLRSYVGVLRYDVGVLRVLL